MSLINKIEDLLVDIRAEIDEKDIELARLETKAEDLQDTIYDMETTITELEEELTELEEKLAEFHAGDTT